MRARGENVKRRADGAHSHGNKDVPGSMETKRERKVVLMLGSQTETGKVISKKLLSSGYHVARRWGGVEGAKTSTSWNERSCVGKPEVQ